MLDFYILMCHNVSVNKNKNKDHSNTAKQLSPDRAKFIGMSLTFNYAMRFHMNLAPSGEISNPDSFRWQTRICG